MLSLRILLRTILLTAGIQLSWGAALASAQHSWAIYHDADANEFTLFAYVSTADFSEDQEACEHTGYETFGALSGPTGQDWGWAPGFYKALQVPLGQGDFDLHGEIKISSCLCSENLGGSSLDQIKVRSYASRWARYNGFDPNAGQHQWIPRAGVQECFHQCAQPNIGLVLSQRPPISGQESFSALQRFGENFQIRGTGGCIAKTGQDSVYDYRAQTGACHITP